MPYKSDKFAIKIKSIYGQYQFRCDRKLRIRWHHTNRKSWSWIRILRLGPIFYLHIIKYCRWRKLHMHFEEESIIYIWSKFQLDIYACLIPIFCWQTLVSEKYYCLPIVIRAQWKGTNERGRPIYNLPFLLPGVNRPEVEKLLYNNRNFEFRHSVIFLKSFEPSHSTI